MAVQSSILLSRCQRDDKSHLVCVVGDLSKPFEERFSSAMISPEDSFAEKILPLLSKIKGMLTIVLSGGDASAMTMDRPDVGEKNLHERVGWDLQEELGISIKDLSYQIYEPSIYKEKLIVFYVKTADLVSMRMHFTSLFKYQIKTITTMDIALLHYIIAITKSESSSQMLIIQTEMNMRLLFISEFKLQAIHLLPLFNEETSATFCHLVLAIFNSVRDEVNLVIPTIYWAVDTGYFNIVARDPQLSIFNNIPLSYSGKNIQYQPDEFKYLAAVLGGGC
jgi:hypothetical protein